MKKISAIIGILAALAFSAAPAFAATTISIYQGSFLYDVYWTTPNIPAGIYDFSCGFDVSGPGGFNVNSDQGTYASPMTVTSLGGSNYSVNITSDLTGILQSRFQTVLASGHGGSCGDPVVFTLAVCSPSTIAHGTIGSYPACTISCGSGYALSAGACVASGGGSSSSPSNTYTLMGITLATGTAAMFLANAASTVSDPGLLEVVAIAVGIPLAFYIFHQLIGLLPKGRAGRRS